jgi:chemotaxis signal transduction protein
MKEALGRLSLHAAELARAFDASFAEAPHDETRAFEDVLAIRLGEDPHALRLSQVAGLFARRTIVPVPSPLPELLGLVSIRAAIVPVYDLSALLGRPPRAAPRWLVLAAQAPIALGFDELEGYRRLSPEAFVAAPAKGALELVRTGEELRPLLNLPQIIESIVARAEQAKKGKGA